MHRLSDISAEFAATLKVKTDLSIRLKNQRLDLEARQLAMVPTDETGKTGWPGKNEGERAINEKRAYLTDPTCQRIQAEINGYEEELLRVEDCLSNLHNERRALEWQIRARLVDAVLGNLVTVQGDPAHIEDTAFEDVLNDIADRELEEQFSDPANGHVADIPEETPLTWGFPVTEPAGIAEEEDIPF